MTKAADTAIAEIVLIAADSGFRVDPTDEASQLSSAVLRLEGVSADGAADLLGELIAAGHVSKARGYELGLRLARERRAAAEHFAEAEAAAVGRRMRPAAG
jgi:hypothetical protein